jgi:hypothetical protein
MPPKSLFVWLAVSAVTFHGAAMVLLHYHALHRALTFRGVITLIKTSIQNLNLNQKK